MTDTARIPARWYVGFVPPYDDKRWWHRFLNPKHKHCFVLKRERDNVWTLVEPWWTRIVIQTVDDQRAIKFLRWAQRGDLLETTEDVPGTSTQVRGWMTCAALTAHILGRGYQVWSPHGLFKKMLREPQTRRVDADVLIADLGAKPWSA